MSQIALLVCLASTLYMAGVAWTIQAVQYPLFALVGRAEFVAFHAAHSARITPVVFFAMSAELLSSLALLAARPAAVPAWLAWAGAACALLTWGSTALIQVPQHGLLSGGYSAEAIAALVRGSWLRTAAWSAHAAIVLAMAWPALARAD